MKGLVVYQSKVSILQFGQPRILLQESTTYIASQNQNVVVLCNVEMTQHALSESAVALFMQGQCGEGNGRAYIQRPKNILPCPLKTMLIQYKPTANYNEWWLKQQIASQQKAMQGQLSNTLKSFCVHLTSFKIPLPLLITSNTAYKSLTIKVIHVHSSCKAISLNASDVHHAFLNNH